MRELKNVNAIVTVTPAQKSERRPDNVVAGYAVALGRKKASTTRTGKRTVVALPHGRGPRESLRQQNTDWEYMSTSGFSVDNIQLCARRTGGFSHALQVPNMAARRRSSVGRCAK